MKLNDSRFMTVQLDLEMLPVSFELIVS